MADHACVIVSINLPKIHRDSLCRDVAFPAKDLVRKKCCNFSIVKIW